MLEDFLNAVADSMEFGANDAWMFLPPEIVGGTSGIETLAGGTDTVSSQSDSSAEHSESGWDAA